GFSSSFTERIMLAQLGSCSNTSNVWMRIGLPAISKNSLLNPAPIRRPLPAAGSITVYVSIFVPHLSSSIRFCRFAVLQLRENHPSCGSLYNCCNNDIIHIIDMHSAIFNDDYRAIFKKGDAYVILYPNFDHRYTQLFALYEVRHDRNGK